MRLQKLLTVKNKMWDKLFSNFSLTIIISDLGLMNKEKKNIISIMNNITITQDYGPMTKTDLYTIQYIP